VTKSLGPKASESFDSGSWAIPPETIACTAIKTKPSFWLPWGGRSQRTVFDCARISDKLLIINSFYFVVMLGATLPGLRPCKGAPSPVSRLLCRAVEPFQIFCTRGFYTSLLRDPECYAVLERADGFFSLPILARSFSFASSTPFSWSIS